MNPITPWDVSRTPVAAGTAVRSAADGAGQFETLLLRQWLTQVRASSLGEDNAPSAGYLQMADDQLAALVASVGGLGLAASLRRAQQGSLAYAAAANPAAGSDR